MSKSKLVKLLVLFFISIPLFVSAKSHSIDDFVKQAQFAQVKISPDGLHIAATFKHGSQTKMAIMSLADRKVKKVLSFGEDNHVTSYNWANNERLLLTKGRKTGRFAIPAGTGNIHAINITGDKKRVIFGPANNDMGYGRIVDFLRDDDKYILVSSNFDKKQFTDIYKVNIYSGKKKRVQKSPYKNATNLLDQNNVYRFSSFVDNDGATHVNFRASEDAEWKEIDVFTEFKDNKGGIRPLSFSQDNTKVFWIEDKESPIDGLYEYDVKTREKKLLFRHEIVDASPIWLKSLTPPYKAFLAGASVMDGKPQAFYFDENNPSVRLILSLKKAFAGKQIAVTSATKDASQVVLYVHSDTDPGSYYLFNAKTNKAQFLVKPRSWIEPKSMAKMKPVKFKARDGLQLHGYLTLPNGKESSKNLPLIVHPHGGPHGPRDNFGFNPEVQFYASLGYAVLQVNFRGSGGYGREFESKGYGKWGQEMQDDLTDGTLWAIKEGYADKDRICISGASYGGYAALMGVVKEPDLYQCAIGYVGVYDLPDMFERGNVAERLDWGQSYLKEVLGEDEDKLKAISPKFNVDKVKADVFLITGGRDLQAHYKQSFDLKDAFKDAGKDVEWLFYKNEGHGYFDPEHRKVLYTKMKAFLAKNIGS